MSLRFDAVLIANRGEIAIRIARACADLGLRAVAVHAEDDAASLHTRHADLSVALRGRGVPAYLDGAQLIEIARAQGCQALHPGYGFLAENAAFARRCAEAGIAFVGPSPETLDSFGDKAAARALAGRCGVPVVAGIDRAVTLDEARAFLAAHGPIMLKAIAGGGGRGMREVEDAAALDEAWARCASEARSAFGDAGLYVEQLIPRARHVEVQVLGAGEAVRALGDRDCSLQRRRQKLVEIAPAPGLPPALRAALAEAALQLARAVRYRGIGTFEFLVDGERFWFIEANPRVQVEHTVTEAISGVDLVQAQLRLAAGATLAELGLDPPPPLRGCAVQLRLNLETLHADGSARPASGVLSAYEPPSGPGLRVDGCGYAGYAVSPAYDPLIAKLVVSAADLPAALRRAYRALCEFRLEGVASNRHLLQNLLRRPELASYAVDTRFVERQLGELLAAQAQAHPHRYVETHAVAGERAAAAIEAPPGSVPLGAPGTGVLVSLEVGEGDAVAAGQVVAVLEAMKMEFEVKAPQAGRVRALAAQPGDSIAEEQVLLFLEPAADGDAPTATEEQLDLDRVRADLAEVLARHARLDDAQRPEAVARRRKTGQRTARENLAALLDPGSFSEYGALVLAAQRRRRTPAQLEALSPADGLVGGTGTVNAAQFGREAARCLALAYDYTVFAGTQGLMNHKKTDRLLALAERWRLPLVLFAEGGGGRPGDTDFNGVAALDTPSFVALARLSGQVPTIGVVSGRCFAGNAALLGCCDVIIAARNASIGMAGPAMIEGGGLGKFTAEEVGPVTVQAPNGVVDVVVEDDVEAVSVARQYLGYFQGRLADWRCADQRLLRHLVPENRLRVYDVRRVIETLADEGSVLELRRAFAPGMITALVRIEGRPLGLLANNPMHLGGAVDAPAADKAARFLQLCEAHGLPIVSLCDTPGFMVGPDSEKQAAVRRTSRMFVAAASLTVPYLTVVLRKGYGLGAQAMAAGSFHAPLLTVSWPSGEFGPMGYEGAVRLGFAKELAAQPTEAARQQLFEMLLAKAYQQSKAMNVASYFELDAVIDPQETRAWIVRGLDAARPAARDAEAARRFIDTW